MIIIRRKRILTIAILLLMVLGIGVMSQNISIQKTVPTMSLPVTNKVIVLDAGHGIPDERSTKQ